MSRNRIVWLYRITAQLCEQINELQYKLQQKRSLSFSHPENAHDDMLWALALSVYGAREPRKPPAFTFGRD